MDGVFISTNSGASWRGVNSGLTNTYVQCLAVSGSNIFVGVNGTNGGIFLSTDNGTNWTPVNAGLTNYKWISGLAVVCRQSQMDRFRVFSRGALSNGL